MATLLSLISLIVMATARATETSSPAAVSLPPLQPLPARLVTPAPTTLPPRNASISVSLALAHPVKNRCELPSLPPLPMASPSTSPGLILPLPADCQLNLSAIAAATAKWARPWPSSDIPIVFIPAPPSKKNSSEIPSSSNPNLDVLIFLLEPAKLNMLVDKVATAAADHQLASPLIASVFSPRQAPPYDPSIVILFAMVMFTLAFSINATASSHPLVVRVRRWRGIFPLSRADIDASEASESVSASSAVMYVVASSAFLLLIFLLPHILVYFLFASFMFSGAASVGNMAKLLASFAGVDTASSSSVFVAPVFPQWIAYSRRKEASKSTTSGVDVSGASDDGGATAAAAAATENPGSDCEFLSWGDVFMFVIGSIVVGTWFSIRNSDFAWILVDLIGISLICWFLGLAHLPDLSVATIFLVGLFVYDVFWVFGSKRFTSDGTSVMEAVAMGVGTSESMPMLLKVPRVFEDVRTYAMLGFGDLIVPGLLLRLARALDLAHASAHGPVSSPTRASAAVSNTDASVRPGSSAGRGRSGLRSRAVTEERQPLLAETNQASATTTSTTDPDSPSLSTFYPFINKQRPLYYPIAMVGYAIGLAIAFLAVYLMKMGQPALLYLVPLTLGPVAVHALMRGELVAIWSGLEHDWTKQQ